MNEPAERRRSVVLVRLSELGASAQAAIPGLYAWAITVAPAAWARDASPFAKAAALTGVIALATAPLVELGGIVGQAASSGRPSSDRPSRFATFVRSFTGPKWARIWSVWGFVLSSAIVWALVPTALSSARLDSARGVLGIVGWALFAFASAGPALRSNADAESRIVAGTALKPRSELPGGDGAYVVGGVVIALGMQLIGWGIGVPERAVLVRLVTVVCGIAVLSALTNLALARHATRVPAARRVRLRRAMPWVLLLVLLGGSGVVLSLSR